MSKTFFFYDLETSGLSVREDRPMQFAGQRTDLDMNPIGEPVNILIKTSNDTLPSPIAVATTGITPQSTQADGLSEAEFCRFVTENVFTPDTIAIGFNSVRYDDEMMRHTFWRNFYDPYEFEWKDGRSRFDILDTVRMTRALRPEGINWPFTDDSRPTNRLELITKLNNISHEHAHDALADVFATIAVAKLIKAHQPNLFKFLLENRDKRSVAALVNLEKPVPFVYASGRYSSEWNNTTVCYPIVPGRNGNVLVYDLRYNFEEISALPEEINPITKKPKDKFYPIVKELNYGKCPAVAPLNVLDSKNDEGVSGWEKIGLSKALIEENLEILKNHPEFISDRHEKIMKSQEYPKAFDPESALYDGFVPDSDKVRQNAVRNGDANSLADFHPNFNDPRLSELLLHYKGRNFPSSLSAEEQEKWEEYRVSRLKRQEPGFMKGLEEAKNRGVDPYLIDELSLWYQSLAPEY